MANLANKDALILLAEYLKAGGYEFVTTTPLSHERVLSRPSIEANSTQANITTRDIFGWNRQFSLKKIDTVLASLMHESGVLAEHGDLVKSKVRFSTLDQKIFMHSSFPTIETDAVFFGPDSYRFASLLNRTIPNLPLKKYNKILDIGAGSGVGGIVAASCLRGRFDELVLVDINPKALVYAEVNTILAGITDVSFIESNLYASVEGKVDLIVSNPPYLIDQEARAYRDGGGEYGSLLSKRIVDEGLALLASGGALVLYTASAIVNGRDTFFSSIQPILDSKHIYYEYREIDPDVFGEELLLPEYKHADRIAVVSLVVINQSR